MISAVTYVPRTPPRHPRSAPPPRTPQWVYHARRLAALALVVLLIVVPVRCASRDDGSVPPPEAETSAEATAVTSEPEVRRQAESSIPASRPVELVVPVIGLRAGFEEGDCRVVDGAIDPRSMDKACAYTAEDRPYSLPGTDADDIVVVAGHTGAGVNAVFNKLYDGSASRHTVAVGDTLFIRTEDSGEDWLEYEATDLHDPDKNALAGDPAIWGDGPMPGRLLTISCIQPANLLADSVRNAVVGWQLKGTVTGQEVETAFTPR